LSAEISNIHQVTFLTPKGKIVRITLSETDKIEIFNIKINEKIALTSLPSHSVGTFV
jgi:hypothetical protein